ncbi:ATP-NAD kinase, partial [Ascoidea rubescens DSM 1968]
LKKFCKNLSKSTFRIELNTILIVTKARDNSLISLTKELALHLLTHYPNIVVYIDSNLSTSKTCQLNNFSRLKYWDKQLVLTNPKLFDLVITLGGDGTILFVSSLFQNFVPPIIGFSLGSLGFLTNFQFNTYPTLFQYLSTNKIIKTNLRLRLECSVYDQHHHLVMQKIVLNEITIDRGPTPYICNLELYGNNSLITIAQADGLCIATPTGSTAYSLSAGGSLVHPEVNAISVTPICPHTLSFRPIVLPDNMTIKVNSSPESRNNAYLAFDGKARYELNKKSYVIIKTSPYYFPTVIHSNNEYFDSVSENLHWNVRKKQKPLS